MMNKAIRCLSVASVCILASCATVPTPLQGNFAVATPRDVSLSGRAGDAVRWGGIVIEVEPEAARTCIQILSRALSDATARPRDRDASEGRFVACREGFYDPEIFTAGREVTVTGRVSGIAERTVGEYAYPMPEIAADVIYLWPVRREYDVMYWDSPWIGWPYYHGWYGTYFYRPHPMARPRPTPRRDEPFE